MSKKVVKRESPRMVGTTTEQLLRSVLSGIGNQTKAIHELTKAMSAPEEPVEDPDEDDPEEIEDEDATDEDDITTTISDDPDMADGRLRSRKVYALAPGALNRTHKIPDRPSSCRKVFRYLRDYEVATVKQIAHSLHLEKKTVGNALAELGKVKLLAIIPLPRV